MSKTTHPWILGKRQILLIYIILKTLFVARNVRSLSWFPCFTPSSAVSRPDVRCLSRVTEHKRGIDYWIIHLKLWVDDERPPCWVGYNSSIFNRNLVYNAEGFPCNVSMFIPFRGEHMQQWLAYQGLSVWTRYLIIGKTVAVPTGNLSIGCKNLDGIWIGRHWKRPLFANSGLRMAGEKEKANGWHRSVKGCNVSIERVMLAHCTSATPLNFTKLRARNSRCSA